MSRQIDISNPEKLSDQDRAYLEQRGRGNIIDHLDYMARVKAAAEAAIQNTPPATPAPPQPEVVVEEVDEPYDKWKIEDLREELKNRQLSQAGNKPELVQRLTEDDANSDS